MNKEERLEDTIKRTNRAQKRLNDIYQEADEDTQFIADLVSVCAMLGVAQKFVDEFEKEMSPKMTKFFAKIVAQGTNVLLMFDKAILFLAVELGEKKRQLDKTERDLAELVDDFYRRKQEDR